MLMMARRASGSRGPVAGVKVGYLNRLTLKIERKGERDSNKHRQLLDSFGKSESACRGPFVTLIQMLLVHLV